MPKIICRFACGIALMAMAISAKRQAPVKQSTLPKQLTMLDRIKGAISPTRETKSERDLYMDEKLAAERAVISKFVEFGRSLNRDTSNVTLPDVPKVAFLFLIMRDMPFETIWDAFFEGMPPENYSIYIHRALVKDEAAEKPNLPLEKWGATSVPWVQTSWCQLFGVEVAALAAALQDPSNTQFVFVSDSAVPLKTSGYVYSQLAQKSPQTSKFCLAPEAEYASASGVFVAAEHNRRCLFRDFYRAQNPRVLKHHQWAVLARDHAAAVIQRASQAVDAYEGAWRKAAPDIKKMGDGCSDESVPLTALLVDIEEQQRSTGNTWADLTRMGVEQQCLTYVRWRNCFHDTHLSLTESRFSEFATVFNNIGDAMNLNNFMKSRLKGELNGFPHSFDVVDFDYLVAMINEGFMFGRKFTAGSVVAYPNGTNLTLSEALPYLWRNVVQGQSEKKVWSALETAGKPNALSKP